MKMMLRSLLDVLTQEDHATMAGVPSQLPKKQTQQVLTWQKALTPLAAA